MGRIWATTLTLLLFGSMAAGQEAKSASAEAKNGGSSSTAKSVQAIDPPLYYLKDKDGKLQAVPGFRYEDFVRLYQLRSQFEPDEPPARLPLQNLKIVGKVAADRAELEVRAKAAVASDRWVRIPLGLDQLVLAKPTECEGAAEQFTTFEPNGDGYVCWVRPKAGVRMVDLTLSGLAPVVKLGEQSTLRLLVPRAVASEMRLGVPQAGVTARATEGTTVSTASQGAGSEITVVGLAADFELTWRVAAARPLAMADLEAVGTVLVRLDGRAIQADVSLNVRSLGEPIDRLQLRLPRGAEVQPTNTSGYALTPGRDEADTATRTIQVELSKRTTGPFDIQFSWRKPIEANKPGEWLELTGVEVPDAVRQWGHVAVAVLGDWQVLWGPARGIRQVDQWPESLKRDDVVACFEYFAQPSQLTARLVPRKTHVSVEPEYVIEVEPDQARLEARLKYTIRGAKVYTLELRMADWEIDEVEPEYLVSADGVAKGSTKSLSLPLVQPTSGQVDLVVRAHRAISAGAKSVQFALPDPQANTQAPALVAVVPADNVVLAPDTKQLTGLMRQSRPAGMKLPLRQQEILLYRGSAARALFAASLDVRKQQVLVRSDVTVDLARTSRQVEQRLSYQVLYEPLDRVALRRPAALNAIDLMVQMDGRPLSAPVARAGVAKSSDGAALIEVALPRPCLGTFDLVLRYALPADELPAGQSQSVVLPLLQPADAVLLRGRLAVRPAEGVMVENRSGAWEGNDEAPLANEPPGTLNLRAKDPTAPPELLAVASRPVSHSETVVERALVQTWLTQTDRQDRVAYRFVSNSDQIEFSLPEGASVEKMLLLLDGKQAGWQRAGAGQWAVAIPRDAATREHVLELRYHFPEGRPAAGRMAICLPQLGRDVWIRRLYWQLILPRNEHVLVSPPDFTVESQWQWQGLAFARQPNIEQARLEDWVGAVHQASPPDDANQYLFSGMGRIEFLMPYTVSRSWIVLAASGAALIAGLLLIYVPFCRRPACLLAGVTMLVCLATLYPEPTLVVSQAATLGLLLTLVAGLLARRLTRSTPAPRPFEPSRINLERGSTQIKPHKSLANPPSTETAPAVAPPATLEWNV